MEYKTKNCTVYTIFRYRQRGKIKKGNGPALKINCKLKGFGVSVERRQTREERGRKESWEPAAG